MFIGFSTASLEFLGELKRMILYQDYAKELISKIGRITELVAHSPSVGTFHEGIVSSYLESFLPRRFSIKTGFVYNSKDKISSPQIDILVIDENIPSAYLFKDKNIVVVMPEAVVCAIEIKTNFDKQAFDDIAHKSKQYREVNPTGFNLLALCFKCKVKKVETVSNWYKSIKIEDQRMNYPYHITVLDDCLIQSYPDPLIKPEGACRIVCNNDKDKEEALLTNFLFTIIKLCEMKDGINTSKIIDTIFHGDFDKLFTIKHQVFKYGVGVVDMSEMNRSNGSNLYRKNG